MCVLQVGSPSPHKAVIWVIARQHPGEPMAEWFAEGLLERLTGTAAARTAAAGEADSEVQQLLECTVLYIVPNMNPDGSVRCVRLCRQRGDGQQLLHFLLQQTVVGSWR